MLYLGAHDVGTWDLRSGRHFHERHVLTFITLSSRLVPYLVDLNDVIESWKELSWEAQ